MSSIINLGSVLHKSVDSYCLSINVQGIAVPMHFGKLGWLYPRKDLSEVLLQQPFPDKLPASGNPSNDHRSMISVEIIGKQHKFYPLYSQLRVQYDWHRAIWHPTTLKYQKCCSHCRDLLSRLLQVRGQTGKLPFKYSVPDLVVKWGMDKLRTCLYPVMLVVHSFISPL